jgi:predicted ribosome quality control (RQC) complex YloA/Tae2 family protein
MKDLLRYLPDFSLNDVHLLKVGRHFRLSPKLKLVVGRNEEENRKIQTFSQGEDILLKVSQYPGPLSLLRGEKGEGEIEKAAALTVRYSKAKDFRRMEVQYRKVNVESELFLSISPISDAEIEALIIN